jgi:uncharacterized protein YbcI
MNEHSAAQQESDGTSAEHSARAEISREMVRLYKELFGRGPTKAKTEFAGPDVVLCTLEHSLTEAEKALAEMGEHQRLRDTRLYFQYATEERFHGFIERVLGRRSPPSSAAWTRVKTWRRSCSTWSRPNRFPRIASDRPEGD